MNMLMMIITSKKVLTTPYIIKYNFADCLKKSTNTIISSVFITKIF